MVTAETHWSGLPPPTVATLHQPADPRLGAGGAGEVALGK